MELRVSDLTKIKEPGENTIDLGGFRFADGPVVPPDGTQGYMPGCYWARTDPANGSGYINTGTYTSSAFRLITTS